jgi:hypothetical protein
MDATITSAGCLVQNLIARTTDGVIIFMAVGGLDSIARMSGLMSGSAGGRGFRR